MSAKSKTSTIVAALIMVVPMVVLRAYVIARLWAWFMVPLGVAEIGLAQAAGLVLLVSMIRNRPANAAEPDPEWKFILPKTVVDNIGASLAALLMGWALAGVMP